jgi:RNA polymerase sigma-H factor
MTDAALVLQARGGDHLAGQMLVRRHGDLAGFHASNYFAPGLEKDDLKQEGLLGLAKAIRDYRSDRQSSFRNFASTCVERQVITAVKAATRKKHKALNTATSLDAPLGEDGSTLSELLSDDYLPSVAASVQSNEDGRKLGRALMLLTPLERHSIIGVANGWPYEEIARNLHTSAKAVDNAVQRARRKLASALDVEFGAAA